MHRSREQREYTKLSMRLHRVMSWRCAVLRVSCVRAVGVHWELSVKRDQLKESLGLLLEAPSVMTMRRMAVALHTSLKMTRK